MKDPSRMNQDLSKKISSLQKRIQELEQAESERKQTEQEIGIIAEIGRLIGSTLDINEVYERFAEEARKLIPFDRIVVNLCNIHENTVTLAYVSGIDIPHRRQEGYPHSPEGTLTEEVLRTRNGLLIQPENTPEAIAEIVSRFPTFSPFFEKGLLSLICVPLISRNEAIGTLHIRSKKPNAYTERDLHMAERIGAQIAGAIANAQLFTDLKEAEKALRESEGRYRALVDQAAVGAAEMETSTGRFLTVNRRLCEMVGRTGKEMLATTFNAITHPDDLQLHDHKLTLLLAGKIGHYSLEKRFLRNDGEIVWVNITVSPLWKPGETPVRNMIVVEDITERKIAEEEKRSLEERLQRAEKMEAIGTLAGGVAHDLNNMLGVLIGNAEMLIEDLEKTDPLHRLAVEIMSSGERAAAEIQNLLTMARRGVILKEPANLNRIVAGLLKAPEIRKMLSAHPDVTIETQYDRDLLNINASAIHIERALTNLISNALRVLPENGKITIRTENRYLDRPLKGYEEVPKGEYAVLSVSDTGIGILPEHMKHLFEPFYMRKVLKHGGTGLGLSVIWGVVKDHDGYADVTSKPGKGTTFTFYFSVTRGESVIWEMHPISQYMGNGETILVVDDEESQCRMAARMLTRLNYRVKTVESGEEALKYLASNDADLIVLDMRMEPGIDGYDTYRRILEIKKRQKAIIFSGFSKTERVKMAQELGAGEFIMKPYLIERLGRTVRNELDRK
jgi:two-component system, cell cycle sensor histidine kinase and response regulator CckA